MALGELIYSKVASLDSSRRRYDTPRLTIAQLAHIDLEGLVLNSKVRTLCDRFAINTGMYFSPEREFLENSIVFSQKNVDGKVDTTAYEDSGYVGQVQRDEQPILGDGGCYGFSRRTVA
ncbi:hypothetical protein E0Z10_g5670 [Xylaria hypoxylon]|uniref:Arginosuccinate synthase C-terminal domain-containing protein n=1 Tax=Xylaria hypoxylon TaxID=37992 RepID=A0A4Z0Z3B9_9PEZI|nr:hypothetical protein E0Z10_g5670 [Xylaria hypoxylon]